MGQHPVFRLEMSYQIRRYLQQNHLSQRAFARKCNIALSTVQRIVKNEGRVKAETAQRIAQGIGCSLGELTGPPTDDDFSCFLHELMGALPAGWGSSPYLVEYCKKDPERVCLYLLWIADTIGLPKEIKWKDVQAWINRSFYEVANPVLPLVLTRPEKMEKDLSLSRL